MRLELTQKSTGFIVGRPITLESVSAMVVRSNTGAIVALLMEKDPGGPAEHIWMVTADDPEFADIAKTFGIPNTATRYERLCVGHPISR